MIATRLALDSLAAVHYIGSACHLFAFTLPVMFAAQHVLPCHLFRRLVERCKALAGRQFDLKDVMTRLFWGLWVCCFALLGFLLSFTQEAEAIPAFARKYGVSCNQCHDVNNDFLYHPCRLTNTSCLVQTTADREDNVTFGNEGLELNGQFEEQGFNYILGIGNKSQDDTSRFGNHFYGIVNQLPCYSDRIRQTFRSPMEKVMINCTLVDSGDTTTFGGVLDFQMGYERSLPFHRSRRLLPRCNITLFPTSN